ncbi:MAG: hypothetical protein LRY52_06090 [Sulfurospirillum cavolei]|nr:hypothetical protein [Sulfurospirillum cavolei]
MRYLITLTPLEPFVFGGDNTFGKLGDKTEGSYIMRSRTFPQQSALLGMLKKEIMTQAGVLTRKVRGEWVDTCHKKEAVALVGDEKFSLFSTQVQNFGAIKKLSPIFLYKNGNPIFKQANLQTFPLVKIGENYLLQNYTSKDNIFDHFVESKSGTAYTQDEIFSFCEHTMNQKGASENSLYKKIACTLKEGFCFGFYLECDYALKNAVVTLGADRSSFKMRVQESNEPLHVSSQYCLLLSDAYITLPLKGNCDFAITSEISYRNLENKKHVSLKNSFQKSQQAHLYEKGSIIIQPSAELLAHLNNANLQKIGYNLFTTGEKNA